MTDYIALLHRGQDGTYGVSFPDLPGCVSEGDNFAKALAGGLEALRLHLDGMREDGETIPPARSLEEIAADPARADWLDGAIITIIPYQAPRGRPVRLNISIDPRDVALVDKAAEAYGMTRSGFLAMTARSYVAEHREELFSKT